MQVLATVFEVANIDVSAPQRLDGHHMQIVTIKTNEGEVVIRAHLAQAAPAMP